MNRLVTVTVAVILFAALSFGLHYGLFSLLNAAGALSLDTITVVSNRALTSDEIIRSSGLVKGDDIFHIDLARTAGLISRHPLVKSAVVRRVPPAGIVIEISEKTPVAYVSDGTNTLLCDGNGGILAGYQASGVPGIAVPFTLTQENGRVTDGIVHVLLDALYSYPESKRIRNITLRQNEGYYLLVSGLDTLFYLGGKAPSAAEFDKAVRIADKILADKLSVRYVDIEKDNAIGYK